MKPDNLFPCFWIVSYSYMGFPQRNSKTLGMLIQKVSSQIPYQQVGGKSFPSPFFLSSMPSPPCGNGGEKKKKLFSPNLSLQGHLYKAKVTSSIFGPHRAFPTQKNYSSLSYLVPPQVTAENNTPPAFLGCLVGWFGVFFKLPIFAPGKGSFRIPEIHA